MDTFTRGHLQAWASIAHGDRAQQVVGLVSGFLARHPGALVDRLGRGRSWPEVLELAEREAGGES